MKPFFDLAEFGQHVWDEARPLAVAAEKRRDWIRDYQRRPEQRAVQQESWKRRAASMTPDERRARADRELQRYRNETPAQRDARNARNRARRKARAATEGRQVRQYGANHIVLGLGGSGRQICAQDVAVALNISQQAARTRLSKLCKAGLLVNVARGRYELGVVSKETPR